MNQKLLTYFNGDEMAANIWQSKYAAPMEVTPDHMHRRLARSFNRIEQSYIKDETSVKGLSEYGARRDSLTEESIYKLFKDFKYIVPQGSVMSNLGITKIGSLSNCFIIAPPEDSYGGIMRADEELAQLMKRRGGVGTDLSTLRPSGTPTTNAAKTTTGAVTFANRYSNTTREVGQDGRRGALMLTMDIRHPDILSFINCKRDRTKVTGANISVLLRDEFMEAVAKDGDYYLRFPCTRELTQEFIYESDLEYNVLNSYVVINDNKRTEYFVKRVKAREIYNSIIENAWDNAEPGQMFIDRHWNYSPDTVYPEYKMVTTNPCGEIGMSPYDACRLIAMNLFSFVDNPFTDSAEFNFKKYYEYTYEAMRLSDDLIDLELDAISEIIEKISNDPEDTKVKDRELSLWLKVYDKASSSRRTGLGFTALGDMLAAMGLKYDSTEALEFVEQVMFTKMKAELNCTVDLAILRGPFKGWSREKEYASLGPPDTGHPQNEFYAFLEKTYPDIVQRMYQHGRRNVSTSTAAPTGTVSIMTQTTSGMEPLFKGISVRRVKINPNDINARVDFIDELGDKWTEYPILHPKFKEWLFIHTNGDWDEHTPIDYLEDAFSNSPWYKSTMADIDWEKRVDMQAVVQKYTTHSISSTINLPEDISKEVVAQIYFKAWKAGLKGVTVYREGSRDGVLLSKKDKSEETKFNYHDAIKRPKELPGEMISTSVQGEMFRVFIGFMDKKPYEVFLYPGEGRESAKGTIVKNGRGHWHFKVKNSDTQEVVVDKDLTSKVPDELAAMTRMASTALRHGADVKYVVEQLTKSGKDITSPVKAIARVLKRYIPDGTTSTESCPECGGELIFEEGCQKCLSCGNSKCG